MDIEFICDMLGGNELVIPNEFSLFEAISRWLMSESHLSSLQEYGNRLLPLIRFPQMFASQLYQLEQVSVKHCKFAAVCMLPCLGLSGGKMQIIVYWNILSCTVYLNNMG